MHPKQPFDPIDVLRKQVDLLSHQFPAHSPRWINALNSFLSEDLGVLALLGPSGLDIHTASEVHRVSPDAVALCLAALTSCERRSGRKIALGLPPGSRHLPLLFAAVSVLADALKRSRTVASGQPSKSLSGVLIVSTDLDVRSRYSDLRIKNESLDMAYPGTRMRPTGELVPLRPQTGTGTEKGVCFLLPGHELPVVTFRPAMAILDVRYGRLTKRVKDIAAWALKLHKQTEVVAIYTLGDRDTASALLAANFEDLPIDHSAIAACSQLKPRPPSSSGAVNWAVLKNPTYLERDHEIIVVEDIKLEKEFATARQMLDDLRRQDSAGLNRARWIFATLSHLVMPVIWYEQTARNLGRSTLRRLIDRLCFRYDSGTGASMQALKMQFGAILDLLQNHNPRAEKLVSILPQLVDEAGKVLLLVRDRVFYLALQSWLDLDNTNNQKWLARVDIRACPDYSAIALSSYPLVLVNGAFPRRYRWIAGGALGDSVKFLAYSSECDAITSQLDDVYGDNAIKVRADKREKFLCRSMPTADESTVPKRVIPMLRLTKPVMAEVKKNRPSEQFKAKATSFGDLGHALETAKTLAQRVAETARQTEINKNADWEDVTDQDLQEDDGNTPVGESAHEDDIKCIHFEVMCRIRGSGSLFLASEQVVECIRMSDPDQVSQILANDLVAGDIVVLVEEDARGSLFDRVVLLAEEQPEMQYLAAYRTQWQETMRILSTKYACLRSGYANLYRDFRAAGSSISTVVSVRNWILGLVMGPEDISSIKAAGSLAGNAALEKHASEFDRAFRTIRALHQGLGRRLTRTIRQSSVQLVEEEPETPDAFGDEIWLPVNELLETIDLAVIRRIDANEHSVSPERVGRFTS